MICIGIESTAHTLGIGVVNEKGKILANIKDTYTTKEGGIIPVKAADHHVKVYSNLIKGAFAKAKINISKVDLISYSRAPGMGHTLKIGLMIAKSLAAILKKPIIGVNHCIAHLEIGRILSKTNDPVLLYASGANTQIIAYEGGKYRVFGEALDGGVGNFLDQFAREMGLGFPGGPKIDSLAKSGKNYVGLPYVVKGMDVSFAGILTNLKTKLKSKKYTKEDLCFSLQETAFAMLVEATERAMAHTGKKELLLGGGVVCNTRLKEMCKIMCKERGAKCFELLNEYNVDNGAMIAWLGILMYKAKERLDLDDADIDPYERTDEVKISWR